MLLRSTLFNILFWTWIAVLGLTCIPLALLYPPFAFTVSHIWARVSLLLLRLCCGITYEVKGREHIPAGACLVASKHQSAWDTIIFWNLLAHPVYVLKRELIFLPVFGWYLLMLRSIYIDRKSGSKALKHMLAQARDRVARGWSIIIFPEGTRTLPGTDNTYHPGVAALYNHLEVPVVPVALNSGVYWSRNAFVKRPGKITIEFLPPIAPGLRSRDFIHTLRESIETASSKLLPGSGN
jgi:1-acyl-sn-glycerol-3-phosphate acyltransferase